jgi:transposase-like protein
VKLRMPRLRSLPFETAIIERYRPRESSVEEALVEMYLAGVSVRRVEDITEALWGTRVSPSVVSDLNQKIYTKIDEWRNRPITGTHCYVYPKAKWQRCMVHFYRNVFTATPRGRIREVATMLKAIHAQEDRKEAAAKAEAVAEKLRRRTRAVGAFPDARSALMLVAARLRHVAGTKWGSAKYLRVERLSEPAEVVLAG